MASFVNGCVFTATSAGTGSFVVSAAVTGWQTPTQAGASNGATYRYRAYSADNTQWEIGSGVYTTGTVTLTRVLIEASSNGGSATNFTLPPAVALTMFDEDIVPFASPTFTGVPASTTAAVDTNTTQIATTAFVLAQSASVAPLGNMATAVVGTSTRYARADHVHPGREVLTANRTYYVATTGSDSNDGLTVGTPFLTLQKAWNVALTLDLNGSTLTIQLADGTYTAGLTASGQIVGGSVTIHGNAGTPANVIVAPTSGPAINATGANRIVLQNFEIRAGGANADGVISNYPGSVVETSTGMRYGNIARRALSTGSLGIIRIGTGFTIAGEVTAFFFGTGRGGFTGAGSLTVTLVGSAGQLDFSIFCDMTGMSSWDVFGMSFTGNTANATGARYSAALNSVINTYGSGASFFPGNSVGSTASGGQYA